MDLNFCIGGSFEQMTPPAGFALSTIMQAPIGGCEIGLKTAPIPDHLDW